MGEPAFEEARALRPETVEEAAAWINALGKQQPVEERAANLGAILAAQAPLVDRAPAGPAGAGF